MGLNRGAILSRLQQGHQAQVRAQIKSQDQLLTRTRDQLKTQDQLLTRTRDQIRTQDQLMTRIRDQLKTQDQMRTQLSILRAGMAIIASVMTIAFLLLTNHWVLEGQWAWADLPIKITLGLVAVLMVASFLVGIRW